jgi:hypothetical protein
MMVLIMNDSLIVAVPGKITLELPPETEARLLAQAKSRGLSLEYYLQTVIAAQSADDPDRAIDDLFDTVAIPPGVGKGVMLRENWYR